VNNIHIYDSKLFFYKLYFLSIVDQIFKILKHNIVLESPSFLDEGSTLIDQDQEALYPAVVGCLPQVSSTCPGLPDLCSPARGRPRTLRSYLHAKRFWISLLWHFYLFMINII